MPRNDLAKIAEEALTKALFLALSAPDDAKAAKAGRMADRIAVGMAADRVTVCKAVALARWRAAK